jgi:hypothetical protein
VLLKRLLIDVCVQGGGLSAGSIVTYKLLIVGNVTLTVLSPWFINEMSVIKLSLTSLQGEGKPENWAKRFG